MRINQDVALATEKILLVPYSEHHVPTYHEWMKDEVRSSFWYSVILFSRLTCAKELQKATASEPLSLEAEYEMQESWRKDSDKLTFIICLPREKQVASLLDLDDAPARMIGDVNLFLSPDEDRERTIDGYKPLIGELEIMIARKDLHRKGYATAALMAFMGYIFENMARILEEYAETTQSGGRFIMRVLRVKIGADNARSIALFQNLFFEQVTEPNFFGEIELRLEVDHDWQEIRKGYPTPNVLEYRRERG